MHYIRFLKAPRFSEGARGRPGSVSALITVTSDLGDSFFFRDVTLTVELAQEGGDPTSILASKEIQWKIGMRTLKVELRFIPPKKTFVSMAISGVTGGTPPADDVSQPVGCNLRIVSVYSSPFKLVDGEEAGRFVERRLIIGCNKILRIWEETGESIARHIWDGGLALTAYLAQNVGSGSVGMGKLNALNEQFRLNKDLKVLELGSGCGIVGLGLASLYGRCHVTLTDLPVAEEILRKNLEGASLQGVTVFKALDWDQAIPQSLDSRRWDIILVADCTYNVASAPALVQMLVRLVRNSPDTVVVLAHKERHDSEKLFFELMGASFLVVDQISFSNGDQEAGILVDIYTFRLAVGGFGSYNVDFIGVQ